VLLAWGPRRSSVVGIHPRINHIKLDKHTRRLLFIAKKLFLYFLFFLLQLSMLPEAVSRVYIHDPALIDPSLNRYGLVLTPWTAS
jgi:hypothetical protein